MTFIKALDPVTITQIAAGEVIDRPSSVLKELIENSLDAGATRIEIRCEGGGVKSMVITDNGSGMLPEDLVLAPLRHTTSKISVIQDLDDLSSFGFRGEALASIGHVARMSITSRHRDADVGYEIDVYQDGLSTPRAVMHQVGTKIDVRELFFELPVRRKFLKSAASEGAQVFDVVQQFALFYPHVDFVLILEGKEVINTSGMSEQRDRLVAFLGKDISPHVVDVDTSIGGFHFKGFVSAPTLTYSTRAKQWVSINGRIVKSPTIQQAIYQAYRDIIVPRRFPLVALTVTMDAGSVDVNIHPQKLDVKFLNPGSLFDALPKLIRAVLQTQLVPVPIENSYSSAPSVPSFSSSQHSFAYPSISETSPLLRATEVLYAPELFQEKRALVPLEYFQVLETYIVLRVPDGVWILDQHAVHERVLYEKIKDAFGQHADRQVLLVSEVLALSPDHFAICMEELPVLHSLGFGIEEFGANQVVIREVPSAFTLSNLNGWLVEYLEEAKDIPGTRRELTLDMKEKLQMKACKAAIKAGQRMQEPEVRKLLSDLRDSPSNYTCPHGRPLFVVLDQSRLERLFLR